MKRSSLIVLLLTVALVLTACGGGGGARETNKFTLDLLKEHKADEKTTMLLVRYEKVEDIDDSEHFIPVHSLSNLYYENFDDYVYDLIIAAHDDTIINIYQANDGYEDPTPGEDGKIAYDFPVLYTLLNKGEALLLYYPVDDGTPQYELWAKNSKGESALVLTPSDAKVRKIEADTVFDEKKPSGFKLYGKKQGDFIIKADEPDLEIVKKYGGENVAFIDQFQITDEVSDHGFYDDEMFLDHFYGYTDLQADEFYASRITSAQDNQLFEIFTMVRNEDQGLEIIELLHQAVYNKGESFVVHYADSTEAPNLMIRAQTLDEEYAQQLLYTPSYSEDGLDSDPYYQRENYKLDGKYAIVGYEDKSKLFE